MRCLALAAVLAGLPALPAVAQAPAQTEGRTFAGMSYRPAVAQAPAEGGMFAGMSKESKALWLNLGVGAVTLGWGAWSWDWGTSGPRFQDEGWFGQDTSAGGADKLGHFYMGYVLSHLFAGQYDRWGFDNDAAIQLGTLSSVGVMGLIEIGDAFSDEYGFSYQDMLFNVLGAAAGYVLWQSPELARKIDIRIEYNPFGPGNRQLDLFTNYDRLRYLVAVKADGFDFIENPYLRYLELHFGYYTRNFDEGPIEDRERNFYVGIGINVTKLLEPYWDTNIFNYVQVPYTYIPYSHSLD